MIKVSDLIDWLAVRADEEVYIYGDDLCCDDDDTIYVGNADEDDDEEDE
jgi:hypothetical protein